MIRWFAINGIAANFLMLGILVAGVFTAFYRVPLEVTPALTWETVRIEMPYLGATAKDVERVVLIPIEESLEDVTGIKSLNSSGYRGRARLSVEAERGTADVIQGMRDYFGGSDTSARQAFEAARRAIIRCGATGYDLPIEKYEQWREIEMTLNPERMRIKRRDFSD